jgi:23S rRNA G2069 N7-methylase RlmK/C1962 C5-methylase RlmI
MVYSGAVDRVVGRPAPKAGDPVLVCDGSERPIGWGLFNPDSMFRVRIMQLAEECFGGAAGLLQSRPDPQQLVAARVAQAVALRASLGLRCGPAAKAAPAAAAEGASTSVFRLVNSEGDRLSGLIVDVLGDHLVVSSSGGVGWGGVGRCRERGLAAGLARTVAGTVVTCPVCCGMFHTTRA